MALEPLRPYLSFQSLISWNAISGREEVEEEGDLEELKKERWRQNVSEEEESKTKERHVRVRHAITQ